MFDNMTSDLFIDDLGPCDRRSETVSLMVLDLITDDLDDGWLHELRRLVEAALDGGGHDLVQQVVHHSLSKL